MSTNTKIRTEISDLFLLISFFGKVQTGADQKRSS